MKATLLFLCLLVCGNVFSQKCADYIEDSGTNDSSYWSKDDIILLSKRNEKFIITAFTFNKGCISFDIESLSGCIDTGAKIIFFMDGSILTFKNKSTFCNAKGYFFLGGVFGHSEELTALTTAKVKTIRVWKGKEFARMDLTEGQQEKLLRIMQCLNDKK